MRTLLLIAVLVTLLAPAVLSGNNSSTRRGHHSADSVSVDEHEVSLLFSLLTKVKKKFHSMLGIFYSCNEEDCTSCMRQGGCRWCPASQTCHKEGSVFDECKIPINSEGQCWGEYCAYQLGEFLNHRPKDAYEWVAASLEVQGEPLMPFPTYPNGTTGIFDLATSQPLSDASGGSPVSQYTIAAIADWGTGTCAAKTVAALAAAESPDMSIHMGDVYFVSTPEQFNTNLLGIKRNQYQEGVAFPKGGSVTFIQMGNHELISGCKGLYENGFSYTGQKTTYAVWQSDSWRVVSLDTGRLCYKTDSSGKRDVMSGETDAPMPDEVVDWLVNVVKLGDPSDKRGILLLSHHQPYDAFSASYPGAANQLNKILPSGKQVLWLFGHNHALAIYKKMQLSGTDFVIYPRLIGIGGFPNILEKPKTTEGLVAYDERTFQEIPDNAGVEQPIGFNGYVRIVISGNTMNLTYLTATCLQGNCTKGFSPTGTTTIAAESYTADLSTGNVDQTSIFISPVLTQVSEPQDEVSSVSCIPPEQLTDYNHTLNHFD